MFAYAVQTACDKNGWILGYSVHPGNYHDSRTFRALYDRIKDIGIKPLPSQSCLLMMVSHRFCPIKDR